jgi:hypothetical protein
MASEAKVASEEKDPTLKDRRLVISSSHPGAGRTSPLVLSCDMPKQKASASSATRKKHARKAAKAAGDASPASDGDDSQQTPAKTHQQRGQKKDKKSKKNEPKVKVYIPPTKPKGAADPVDLYGLHLPGELQACFYIHQRGYIPLF